MEKIGSYWNGNYLVTLYDDGTKIRSIKDGTVPHPEFPESIDMCMTKACDVGCPHCHEQATPNGAHADLIGYDGPLALLCDLHPFTEVAIGGGNPLSFPDLDKFLILMAQRRVICNITVHHRHFFQSIPRLTDLVQRGLLHGIGVSINDLLFCEDVQMLEKFAQEVTVPVIHTIAGVADRQVFAQLGGRGLKLLILGYKEYGRGFDYYGDHAIDIYRKKMWLSDHLTDLCNDFEVVAFDNLAIDQLHVRRLMNAEQWEQFYMGNDGQFTMYIDLVSKTYAKSSTSERLPIDVWDVGKLFQKIRRKNP